jgi:acyl-coenzyme A thioesterase PaaI-like protein
VSQQHGYVHAGVVSAIVDIGGRLRRLLAVPEDSSVLTVEFKLNLLAPPRGER